MAQSGESQSRVPADSVESSDENLLKRCLRIQIARREAGMKGSRSGGRVPFCVFYRPVLKCPRRELDGDGFRFSRSEGDAVKARECSGGESYAFNRLRRSVEIDLGNGVACN